MIITIKLIKKLTGKNNAVFTDNIIVMEHYQWLLKGFNNMAMRFHKLEIFNNEQLVDRNNKIVTKSIFM